MSATALDPRVRILYVLALGFGVFLTSQPVVLAGLCGAQIVLWLAVGLSWPRLLRQIGKLWFFSIFIVAT